MPQRHRDPLAAAGAELPQLQNCKAARRQRRSAEAREGQAAGKYGLTSLDPELAGQRLDETQETYELADRLIHKGSLPRGRPRDHGEGPLGSAFAPRSPLQTK